MTFGKGYEYHRYYLPKRNGSTCLTLAVPTTRPIRRLPSSVWRQLRATARVICSLVELKTSLSPTSSTKALISSARPSRCWTAIAQCLPALELRGGWQSLFCMMGAVTQRSMSMSMALDMVGEITCIFSDRKEGQQLKRRKMYMGSARKRATLQERCLTLLNLDVVPRADVGVQNSKIGQSKWGLPRGKLV